MTKPIEEIIGKESLRCPGLMEDNKTCFMFDKVCPWYRTMITQMPTCEDYAIMMINAISARNAEERII